MESAGCRAVLYAYVLSRLRYIVDSRHLSLPLNAVVKTGATMQKRGLLAEQSMPVWSRATTVVACVFTRSRVSANEIKRWRLCRIDGMPKPMSRRRQETLALFVRDGYRMRKKQTMLALARLVCATTQYSNISMFRYFDTATGRYQ